MQSAPHRFETPEYLTRIRIAQTRMEAQGTELLICVDPSNMNWLTGYDGWSFYVHQAVLLPVDGTPIWFGRGMDRAGARITCWMRDDAALVGYEDHYVQSTERHPMERLSEIIAAQGWGSRRIGVEMDNYYYSAAAHAALQKGLPDARLQDCAGLVNWARAVKSPRELEYMRDAGRIVTKMHQRIFTAIEPGMRKCDIAAVIYDSALRGTPETGGDYPAIAPMFPSGAEASAPHLTWDDRPLRAGEATFFEIAGCRNRYHCPLSRTIHLGPPPDHLRAAEEAVLEGMEAGMAKMRAGNACEEVAIAFFDTIKRRGFEKDSRAGYPIGISYPPDWGERSYSLRRGDRTVFQPGMTLHFMTALWGEDWGLELTESLVVHDGPPERLADMPLELYVKE